MTPGVRPGTDPRVVVLDNEAAQALARSDHPKHARVMRFVDAVAVRKSRGTRARVVVPTVVRIEAGIDRRSPVAAAFNRLQVRDVPGTESVADEAAALRPLGGGSAVDACVAVTAVRAAGDDATVVVLTADLTDVPRLVAASGTTVVVRRI
jgi:predicted nucleic acid-binding protein